MRLKLLLILILMEKEQLLYPNQYVITQHIMFGPLSLIMNPEWTLITQMLLTILTKFPWVVLLTLLTNNLKHCVIIVLFMLITLCRVLSQMMILCQMLFKTWLTLNYSAFWTFYIYHVQVAIDILGWNVLLKLVGYRWRLWMATAQTFFTLTARC